MPMCKPSTYLVVTYFLTFILDLFLIQWVANVKPNVNPYKPKPLGGNLHYEKSVEHISSWIYAHIKRY
jgi:hypothetical protein